MQILSTNSESIRAYIYRYALLDFNKLIDTVAKSEFGNFLNLFISGIKPASLIISGKAMLVNQFKEYFCYHEIIQIIPTICRVRK